MEDDGTVGVGKGTTVHGKKSITIELNGVSSKLEASLKSVNSEIGNEYPYAGPFSENSQKKLAIQRRFG